MLTPYTPLDFMEALARERRADPRVLAASGTVRSTPSPVRQRISRVLIQVGHWIEGSRPQAAPIATRPC